VEHFNIPSSNQDKICSITAYYLLPMLINKFVWIINKNGQHLWKNRLIFWIYGKCVFFQYCMCSNTNTVTCGNAPSLKSTEVFISNCLSQCYHTVPHTWEFPNSNHGWQNVSNTQLMIFMFHQFFWAYAGTATSNMPWIPPPTFFPHYYSVCHFTHNLRDWQRC
jgi:hypothetical protein